jgi:RNA polymerase sigma-70 factor (ECF subfamily)
MSEEDLPVSPSAQPGEGGPSEPTMAGRADLELLKRVARKDEAAFAELYQRLKGRVLNLAYRYLGNREDAELATQDTFLKVWHGADRFRGTAQVWTWIYRIAANLCLNMKSRKPLPTEELDDTVPASDAHQPADVHVRREQEELVRKALDCLPPDQRMAIVLSRFEQLSYEEIGQTMNKSPRAVATLLFRARENLKHRLLPFQRRGLI